MGVQCNLFNPETDTVEILIQYWHLAMT